MKLNLLSSQMYNALTPPARRPSGEVMGRSLQAHGTVIEAAELSATGGDVKRLNALHQLDFAGGNPAFDVETGSAVTSCRSLACGAYAPWKLVR